jgi:hypothetical protein
MVGDTVYTANYFSDTLSALDLKAKKPQAVSVALGPRPNMNTVRQGEYHFNDATLCQQAGRVAPVVIRTMRGWTV